MDGNRITKDNLIRMMQDLTNIYDVVRLVEPESTSVVVLGEHGLEVTKHEPCFAVWEKDQRCSNCISMRACVENRKFTKFEFRKDEAYSVLAMPYTVIDGENEYKVSLELVNRVQETTVLQAEGMDARAKQIMEFNMKLYQDSLTGAFNRRYYDEHRYIYELPNIAPKKLGYLIVDIDCFKQINDTYGHQHGDELLSKVVETLKANVRNTDCIMRIGGDEFLIVMQNCDRQFIEKKKTQLKRAVSMVNIPWLGNQTLSISAGMAYTENFSCKQEELSALFAQADKEMYADKKHMKSKQEQLTVLVVDDVEMNRSLARKLVEKQYKVMEAANGVEALAILNTNQIDVIVTDIFMDEMNGYELMQKVKSIPHFRDIPIIAVTVNSESSQRQAIEAGADIYIDRPLSGYNLLEDIRRLTRTDFGRRELFDVDFLLDTIPGAVVVFKLHDTEMEVVSCSRGIFQLCGWNANEFCRKEISGSIENIFPADVAQLQAAVGRMARTHSRAEILYRAYKKDGSLVWIWFQGRYIGEEDGCPVIEATLLDVSSNTDMYQLILDETSAMVTIIDAQTYEVIYANKKAIESSSCGEEYIGRTCYKTIHHLDAPCKDCLLLKSADVPAELERVSYAGHTYKMLKKRMTWNNRKVLLEYSEDITDEVRASQLENELNADRQKLVDQVPTGIGIYEVKGSTISQVYMNNAFYDMIATTREGRREYFAENSLGTVHPEDVNKLKASAQELMDGLNITQADYRLKNGNGDWIWLHAVTSVIERKEDYVKLYCAFYECTESKQLQLQLLQNQRAVALAEQLGHLAIWTYNIDKGFIEQQTLVDAKGHLGYPVRILNAPQCFVESGNVHPEDIELFLSAYHKVDVGDEDVEAVYRLKDQDTGAFSWVRMYYKRIENNDDGDRMAVGFSLDVNEQQQAIERYQTEEKLREDMYASAIIYLEYNLTKSVYVGKNNLEEHYRHGRWENATIEEYRENMSQNVEAPYLDEVAAKMYAGNLLKAFERGETRVFCEYRSKERPGKPSFWCRMTAVMVKRPDTGDVMAFVYVEDIEKAKNRRLAIESSMSDGIENVAIIHLSDGQTRLIMENGIRLQDEEEKQAVYNEDFVTRSSSVTVQEEREFSYHAALLPTIKKELGEQEVYQYSITTQLHGGQRKRKLFRFRYLDDRKTNIIMSISDITSLYLEEQKQKRQLEEALSEVQNASHAKADFYSRMSHDMRTPMNGILGMANLSEGETDIEKLKENMGKVKDSGEYLLSLINDTLDIQRIESGKMKLEPTIVSTMDVVRNILEMIQVTANAKGVTLKYHKGNADLNWYIRADALRLKQIFINLLSNAVKFTPAGGTVEFEFKLLSRDGMISHDVVYVRDTGVGMSKEFLESGIFKPFSQERNAVSGNYAGSGLGLSIAKSLVEMMGGHIEVESELGAGTTFAVYLDFERVSEAEAKTALQSKKEQSKDVSKQLKGRKILLAEDHPLNAEIAKKLLEKVGCEVTWAKNGQEAVSIFADAPVNAFDAILMDIRMPVMDGLEAARQIRALEKADAATIPVVAMTANAYEEDAKASLDAGMNAHLGKPIEPNELYLTLATYLTR